jgi:hypothetical protein
MVDTGGRKEVQVPGPKRTSEYRLFEDANNRLVVEREFTLEAILGSVSVVKMGRLTNSPWLSRREKCIDGLEDVP